MIIQSDSLERRCNVCFVIKPLSEFYNDKTRNLGKSYTCKTCKNNKVKKYRSSLSDEVLLERGLTTNKIRRKRYYRKYKNTIIKKYTLQKRYGLTIEQLNEMKHKQKDMCAICGRKIKLVVDHCHKKNKVRGLLCSNCNSGLGMFNDDIDCMKKAIKYLEGSL
jgi:hypothetical protein